MQKSLQFLDFFSREIYLTKDKSNKHSTIIGVVFSILIQLLTISLMIFYINKIFERELQSSFIQSTNNEDSPIFNFTEYIPYIVKLEDENFLTPENPIISVNSVYETFFL